MVDEEATKVRVTVLLFANAKDAAGGAHEAHFELEEQATLTSLLNRLISRFPSIAAVLERSAIAINEEYVGFSFEAQKLIEKADSARSNSDQNFEGNNDTLLRNNDVVAVIPPVSGG